MPRHAPPTVVGIDLFCGAGGLTLGLRQAGIDVVAGVDLDPTCEFPFVANNGSLFIEADVRDLSGREVRKAYPKDSIRLLAACAPCQPFSPLRRAKTSDTERWGLVRAFRRLVSEVRPELVTMENVPALASNPVFDRFVRALKRWGYSVDWASVYCPRFGIPQHRRRLVLLASAIGPVRVPLGDLDQAHFRTVRQAIGRLPRVDAGKTDPKDPLHVARSVSEHNMRRLRASTPGGSWRDWPDDLRADCHKRTTGSTFGNVYGRMSWDEPAPTITTLARSFGSGRFGHPEQDRALTLREAAVLQTFPRNYRFAPARDIPFLSDMGRLIGNAVPPRLAYFIGLELMRVASARTEQKGQR